MNDHTDLRSTLAKFLNKELPKVVKLDDVTYIINGVVSKKLKHGWFLKSQVYPDGFFITHPKIGIVLPWILHERKAQDLCDKILKLDQHYGYAVFEMDNQRRLMNKYKQQGDDDRMLVHLTKFNLAKQRARQINAEIQSGLARVKIAK